MVVAIEGNVSIFVERNSDLGIATRVDKISFGEMTEKNKHGKNMKMITHFKAAPHSNCSYVLLI